MSDPRDDPTDGEPPPKCKDQWDAADVAEDAYTEAEDACSEAGIAALEAEAEYLLACLIHGNDSRECLRAMFASFDADDAYKAACEAAEAAHRERAYRERLVAECISDHKFMGNVWLPRWEP